jgi:hypothetical protein
MAVILLVRLKKYFRLSFLLAFLWTGVRALVAEPATSPHLGCADLISNASIIRFENPNPRHRDPFSHLKRIPDIEKLFPEYVRSRNIIGVYAFLSGIPADVGQETYNLQPDFIAASVNPNVTPVPVITAAARLAGLRKVDWDIARSERHVFVLEEIAEWDPSPLVRIFVKTIMRQFDNHAVPARTSDRYDGE